MKIFVETDLIFPETLFEELCSKANIFRNKVTFLSDKI